MKVRLTKRFIDAQGPAVKEDRFMDTEVKGFGLRITKAGGKFYFLRYRHQGERILYTIGTHGQPWTVDNARKEALRLLGQVVANKNPANEKFRPADSITVNQLCDDYIKAMEAGTVLTRLGAPKKASTLDTDRGRINRHIKPLLGRRQVKSLVKRDIEQFRDGVAQGKTAVDEKTRMHGRARVTGGAGTATRTLGLLGGIITYAIDLGIRDDNPVHGVRRAPDKKRNRAISKEEYASIGAAINSKRNEGGKDSSLDALLALILTGCRKGEVIGLKWAELDVEHSCLRLEDTKTGQQIRPIGKAAIAVLARQTKKDDNPFVFPATRKVGFYQGLPKVWRDIREELGLLDVTIHTFRHAFASVASELGYSELTIAGMLGHSSSSVTARYVHVVDSALVDAATKVADEISERLDEYS